MTSKAMIPKKSQIMIVSVGIFFIWSRPPRERIRLRSTSESGPVGASRRPSEACIRVRTVLGLGLNGGVIRRRVSNKQRLLPG